MTLAPTSTERSLQGKVGAYALHAKYDSRELTAKARSSFLSRFEREVDPNNQLPQAERLRRALSARRAYFTRLSLKAAQARRRREGGAK